MEIRSNTLIIQNKYIKYVFTNYKKITANKFKSHKLAPLKVILNPFFSFCKTCKMLVKDHIL